MVGDVEESVEVLVEGAESRFFRRSGRSAGMSVAVYLRTRGLSASARSPVPALFIYLCRVEDIRVWMGRGFLGVYAPEFKNVRLTELFVVK